MILWWAAAFLFSQLGRSEPARVSVDAQKPLEVTVYSDFQCPFCAQIAPAIRELERSGVDDVPLKITFKDFPLSIHPKALLAHYAALAAGEQGKFWEMHDLLFANQRRADRGDLIGYATQLGLDVKQFEEAVDSDRVKKRIADDMAEGAQRGVNATPTILVNGKPLTGARTTSELKTLVIGAERLLRVRGEISEAMFSRGPAAAQVTIELFADLQSLVTRPALDVINRFLSQHPTDVRVQFKHYPLAFHSQASLAHEATMVAGREGRFWEMASFILSRPVPVREVDILAEAARLGLDQARFATALAEHRYKPIVDAEVSAALGRGVKGSPSVVINGTRIDGVPALETLERLVTSALSSAAAKQAAKQ